MNLAELERRTGISRKKLRNLKKNGFKEKPDGRKGRKNKAGTVLSGYAGVLDDFLRNGVKNSVVIFEKLKELGYQGKITQIKVYIQGHKNLLPARRQIVSPQGNRGIRYFTGPGEAYQMDWGFVTVILCIGILLSSLAWA